MRTAFLITILIVLAGCSTHGVVHHSPYDLDRDGVMDVRCAGLDYDTSDNTLYSWRSRGSSECEDWMPMEVKTS